jgi:hypothetical protein
MLYLPGLKNVVAGFLSPPPSQLVMLSLPAATPIDFEAMAAEQNRCPETQR